MTKLDRLVRDHWMPPLVGLVVAIWTLTIAAAVGFDRHPPTGEEAKIAIHLANGDGFRSPVDDRRDAKPSAWSAPVYPAIIGLTYRMLGVESGPALTLLVVVNAMCVGLIAAAMCRLGVLIFGSAWPGVAAAALIAVDPLFYAGNFWDGLAALALFAMLLVLVVQRTLQPRAATSQTVLIGGVAGVLALTNASYVFTFPILAVTLATRRGHTRDWRSSAIAFAVLAVVVAPWSIRNYAALGRVVLIRTGAGVQMRIGNAPVSHGWIDRHAYGFHPFVNPAERMRLLAMGEPAYDADALSQFARTALNDPVTYLIDCGRRAAYLVAGNPNDDVSSPGSAGLRWFGVVASSLIACLALVGMIGGARVGLSQHLLPAILGSLALPFVASAVIDRYRLPTECLLFFYCGVAAWMIATRGARRSALA
jgi:hypothetical protein